MTAVSSLGYLGFEVSRLGAWEDLATGVLGLEVAERGADGSLAFRLDDYRQRIVLDEGPADDLSLIGWEVEDGATLDALGERLMAAGIAVSEATPDEAGARHVERLLTFRDPNGIASDLFHGPEKSPDPFRSPLAPSGFVTGEEGLGHVFLNVGDAPASADFYCNVLGFKISDYIEIQVRDNTVRLIFLHANPRHHTVSFGSLGADKRVDHFMVQVGTIDDVGAAYDRCQDLGVPITRTLGRHPNDRMVSFYALTPSGFAFELGCGGRKIDDATWQIETYNDISEWGHRRPVREQQA